MTIPIYQVDAFAERVFEGNPAAVCPLEAWLPDRVLQAIAEENRLSETAFVVGGEGSYDLRWFTPVAEVDLCGHATLATAHVLFGGECRELDEIAFESRSGSLRVTRRGRVLTMDFPVQERVRCEAPRALVEGLGVMPVEFYTGVDGMALLQNEAAVAGVSPDFQRLRDVDCRGVIVTARGEAEDFVSRYFAPRFGIDEDPVTGSAHCMLAPYWAERLGQTELEAKQISKRGGRVTCRVKGDRVLLSGQAVTFMEGTISLGIEAT